MTDPDGLYEVELNVDGVRAVAVVGPDDSLLRALRQLGRTGVTGSCEEGECGSCTARIDGLLLCSCLVPAVLCGGSRVDTVAAMVSPELADALVEHGAVQCGFCTPGFVVSASAAVQLGPEVSELQVRELLAGNLCRCTGYEGLVNAVLQVARSRPRAR